MGGGTTVREFIRLIPNDLHLTVFTVSVISAIELLDKPNIKTIMIGGAISPYSQMCISGDVYNTLGSIKADLLILGTNALDIEGGFSDSDWDTVQVKKWWSKHRKRLLFLPYLKTKYSIKMKIADLSEVDYVVTEANADNEKLQPYKNAVPNLTFI